MKISKIYDKNETVLSCEVFPPKPEKSIDPTIFKSLKKLKPHFISVTYGAGGGTKSKTVEMVDEIKNNFNMETLMHLTCIDSTSRSIKKILSQLKKKNIENILALRGDIPKGKNPNELIYDFKYASDLVKFIKRKNRFSLGVAGYPEKHPQASSYEKDIQNLKYKVTCGADFIITQLFFNNDFFYKFIDTIRSNGIQVPVSAGIMPVFRAGLVKKMVQMCGASIPSKLRNLIEKYKNKPEDMEKAGIDYATAQVHELINSDTLQGIHIYTMNRPRLAKAIVKKSGLKQ